MDAMITMSYQTGLIPPCSEDAASSVLVDKAFMADTLTNSEINMLAPDDPLSAGTSPAPLHLSFAEYVAATQADAQADALAGALVDAQSNVSAGVVAGVQDDEAAQRGVNVLEDLQVGDPSVFCYQDLPCFVTKTRRKQRRPGICCKGKEKAST